MSGGGHCGQGVRRAPGRGVFRLPRRSPAAPQGHRAALCVGIDRYASVPLSGCVRDARAWSAELNALGFSVSMLLDLDATRERIVRELTNLVTSAAPGDVLVFQYSGHGTQVEDIDGDEADHFDEAFVPVDYETGAFLIDDDLARIYGNCPAAPLLTLFMDCCHSGTNSRFVPFDSRPLGTREHRRYLPMSPWLEQAHRAFRSRLGEPVARRPRYRSTASCTWPRAATTSMRTSQTGRATSPGSPRRRCEMPWREARPPRHSSSVCRRRSWRSAIPRRLD